MNICIYEFRKVIMENKAIESHQSCQSHQSGLFVDESGGTNGVKISKNSTAGVIFSCWRLPNKQRIRIQQNLHTRLEANRQPSSYGKLGAFQ